MLKIIKIKDFKVTKGKYSKIDDLNYYYTVLREVLGYTEKPMFNDRTADGIRASWDFKGKEKKEVSAKLDRAGIKYKWLPIPLTGKGDRLVIITRGVKLDSINKDSKVKDSDKLKQLAYAFVKKADELDHANQALSRNALKEKSDPRVMNELLKIAIEVERQLQYEITQMKKNVNSQNVKSSPYDNKILDFLSDGADRCVWANDSKLQMLGKKIRNLVSEYRRILQYNTRDSFKSFKVNGQIVKAKNFADAVKQVKDSSANEIIKEIEARYPRSNTQVVKKGGKDVIEVEGPDNGTGFFSEFVKKLAKKYNAQLFEEPEDNEYTLVLRDSIKDEASQDDLQFLIDDEIEAINGYKRIIAKTENPALLDLLGHIMKEELEHLEELRNAQTGKFEICDSVINIDDMNDMPKAFKSNTTLSAFKSNIENLPKSLNSFNSNARSILADIEEIEGDSLWKSDKSYAMSAYAIFNNYLNTLSKAKNKMGGKEWKSVNRDDQINFSNLVNLLNLKLTSILSKLK